jgi:hypothetical protein
VVGPTVGSLSPPHAETASSARIGMKRFISTSVDDVAVTQRRSGRGQRPRERSEQNQRVSTTVRNQIPCAIQGVSRAAIERSPQIVTYKSNMHPRRPRCRVERSAISQRRDAKWWELVHHERNAPNGEARPEEVAAGVRRRVTQAGGRPPDAQNAPRPGTLFLAL